MKTLLSFTQPHVILKLYGYMDHIEDIMKIVSAVFGHIIKVNRFETPKIKWHNNFVFKQSLSNQKCW